MTLRFLFVLLVTVCSLPRASSAGSPAARITVRSPAFAEGQRIPIEFTGEGSNISPPLLWEGLPREAKELALIVDDPDAPGAEPWVHWLIYGLSPAVGGLPQAVPQGSEIRAPVHAFQGKGSGGSFRYSGPMPPKGHGLHHYRFTLYALDRILPLAPGADRASLERQMRGHIIGEGALLGTYER